MPDLRSVKYENAATPATNSDAKNSTRHERMKVFQTGGTDTVSESMTIAQPMQNKMTGFRTDESDNALYMRLIERSIEERVCDVSEQRRR